MTKTIYAVTRGSYSDYSIFALFDTKEKAQACIDANSPEMNDYIEEYELNRGEKHYRTGECIWLGFMDKSGNCDYEPSKYPYDDAIGFLAQTWREGVYNMRFIVWATSAEHALKIANEHRAQLIASGEWGKEKVT